jgi:molybdopterin converting factor subunit 1
MLYFAVLRDIVGRSDDELALAEGTRAAAVWERLRGEHPQLARYEHPPMVAINERYAQPDAVLHDGDELAFIPPVAGG